MKVIYKIGLLCCIWIIIMGNISAQKRSDYRIRGNVKDIPDGTLFFLIRAAPDGDPDTIQRAAIKKGEFTFRGKLSVEGELHWIKMDTSKVKIDSKKRSWIVIMLTNSNINIKSELHKWPSVLLQGTQSTLDFNEFLKSDSISRSKYIALKAQNPDSFTLKKINESYHDSLVDFINNHPKSYVLPWIIRKFSREKIEDKELAFGKLPEDIKNSFYGKRLKSDFISARLMLIPGSTIPDFKINMQDGKPLSVKEIVAKAKLTLIDFWGSWCKPCRDEVPRMKKVYNTFHDAGFNILGVACGDTEKNWRKAIKDDNSNWMHGIDDKENAGDLIFKLKSFPAMILVDRKGKIIACYVGDSSVLKTFGPTLRGENGDELYRAIEQILSNYKKSK